MNSAFDHHLVRAAGLAVQPPDPIRDDLIGFLDMPEIGCPFHTEIKQLGCFTEATTAELIFLYAAPIQECDAAFSLGRVHFRREALRRVGELPEVLIEELLNELLQTFDARCTRSHERVVEPTL